MLNKKSNNTAFFYNTGLDAYLRDPKSKKQRFSLLYVKFVTH